LLAALPDERRNRVAARTDELVAELEGLKSLRLLADRSQAEIAARLGAKQPSVHKIKHQVNRYLSTLRPFVEATGGNLELREELPDKGVPDLTGLGDLRG
jgi:DNA-directed RNA polymerase specialized sigma24 family protein